MTAVEDRVDALEARTRTLEARVAELERTPARWSGVLVAGRSALLSGLCATARDHAGSLPHLRSATAGDRTESFGPRVTAAGPEDVASGRTESFGPRVTAAGPEEAASGRTDSFGPRVAAASPQEAGSAAPEPPRSAGSVAALSGATARRARSAGGDFTALEDLLGGRVLAWAGGVAMLVGIVFLLAIAVSRGWIGEGTRTALAAAVSLGLLACGVRLFEHRGRTEAALAATAAGIAALFATVTVATQVYELVPALPGMAGALGVGATATFLAVRWRAQGIGALGIVGALAAPLLVGAPSETGTIALLLVATGSASAVLLWQRWSWLAFVTFVITVGQWAWWLFDAEPSAALVIATVSAFGALYTAGAAGFEVRMAAPRLRVSSSALLALSAFACAAAGWYALDDVASRGLADGWLAALAAAYLVSGTAGLRSRRVSHELGLVALGLGTILADVAFAQVAGGLPLVVGWAAGAIGFAWLVKHVAGRRADLAFAGLGLGGHVALALGHALVTAGGGEDTALALAALAVAATGCFVSARLARDGHRAWRVVLDALGLAVVAYASTIAFDGMALALAWTGESVALTRLARRSAGAPAGSGEGMADAAASDRTAPTGGPDKVTTIGALAFLLGALGFTLAELAPPDALVVGLDPLLPALGGLGAVAGAAALGALWLPSLHRHQRPALIALSAVVTLYAASAGLVTPFQPGAGSAGPALVRQQGQTLVSGLWALVGLGTLVTGLVRDRRALRLAGLGLLATAVGKVFLFDLASLTSVYRVASFIALGLLLLCGAFAWQRVRPRPPADLRAMPEGLR